MSVINSMLKDLDKRQQSHELENLNVAPVQYQAKPESLSKLPWVLFTIVSALLLCGIVYSWQALSSAQLVSSNSTSSQLSNVAKRDLALATEVQSSESDAHLELAETSLVKASAASMQDTTSISKRARKFETESVRAVTSSDKTFSSIQLAEEPLSAKLKVIASDPVTSSVPVNAATSVITSDTAVEPISLVVSSVVVTPISVKPSSMAVTEVQVSNEQLAQRRYRLAIEAENQGLLSDAIVYYSEVLTLTPVMHQARRKLAALYYGQGRLGSASDILIKGSALFPEEYDYPFLLARVQQASGDIKLAMSSLELIPDESQLAKQKWTMQSSLAQKAGKYPLAEESYRKLLRQDPHLARWWMGLGYALDSQLEYDPAKQAYRQALSADGLSQQAREYIKNRLVQLGESE
ncbi:tetratricopeptide repeat protein [Shewanella violacea]|uniref:MSHA biogenesis protein MshN, putative n=1 Tax=Shewanella violacea (strain JCM 10179 / CIP 106290 / LMG 19151 / DSS12) TaxID=637905 RepID=D4ZEM9_SHEVD|nr:tetratricopeptide repeat protein [Shewanella violacea]BAJ00259.1 MSHA biogenesis protein MshN, putative [Shewanella violacea DSS12]